MCVCVCGVKVGDKGHKQRKSRGKRWWSVCGRENGGPAAAAATAAQYGTRNVLLFCSEFCWAPTNKRRRRRQRLNSLPLTKADGKANTSTHQLAAQDT